MTDGKYIVCMRADAPKAALGSIFTESCTECTERVMIAPSGQSFIKDHPDAKILCSVCFGSRSLELAGLAASPEQIANEILTAGPNPWRNRN